MNANRIAHHIGRLVREMPGRTPGSVHRVLATRDRPMSVEAAVLAVTLGLIEVRGGRLYPGPNEPLQRGGHSHSTAARLAAALAERGVGA
jgi:hypothetical protein